MPRPYRCISAESVTPGLKLRHWPVRTRNARESGVKAPHSLWLVGGGGSLGWVNFDAALEISAVFDADARRRNVAGDRAVLLDVHAATGVDIAHDFSEGNHVPGVNLGSELGGGADRELVTLEPDRTFDDAVNLQVFGAVDLALDLNARTQTRTTAGRGAAELY